MAKKRTLKNTAPKTATKTTKGAGKKPAKRPLAKPKKCLAKSTTIRAAAIRQPAAEPTKRPLTKPTKSPVKDMTEAAATTSKQATEPPKNPPKNPPIEVTATISGEATEEAKNPERTWVVWQDGRGIWVGTQQDFKHSKRPETIVCDVIDRGSHQASTALQQAIQLGETLRQAFGSHMKYWLQYDDAAQKQRIQEWYERLTM